MAGWFRATNAVLLLAGGMFVAATIDNGIAEQQSNETPYSALEPPTFSIVLRRDQLMVEGFTSSSAHEKALSRVMAEEFNAHETSIDFRSLVVLPETWPSVTTHLLQAVAATGSANAVVNERLVEIRGVTTDPSSWSHRLTALRAAMPAGMALDADVIAINGIPSLAEMCLRAVSQTRGDGVEFRHSSTEIRTSSYAILDTIIDMAYDCQELSVAITGHSDASGNEASNQRLSLARAQAVADYLARGGITSDRLIVAGAGSLVPVADNTTSAGRSLNRRVEFDLRPPGP